jgi:serine/threonine-protein kinase
VQDPQSNAPPEGSTCPRCGARHDAASRCADATTLSFGAPPPPPLPEGDPLVGSQVGSFRIVRLLGRGGMGTVYLAEHPVIGSRVAVKFLHESMASDPALVARFYDEARAVNLIGHENIVGIYDLSMLPSGRYYFVMELLEGETLSARLRAGPVAAEMARDVLLQTCDALQCAHEHGVVHRDLKPENVFLVPRRGKPHFVKIVDFGIAKLRGARRQTGDGLLVGTPEYMAPEQCDEGPIDARTDVYALGVMAFELATGRLPFAGRSVPQLLLAQLREPPPRPSALAPVAPGLEAAILKALEKDPARRFQSMEELAEALEAAWVRPATSTSTSTPTPTSTPTSTPTPTPTSTSTSTSTPTSTSTSTATQPFALSGAPPEAARSRRAPTPPPGAAQAAPAPDAVAAELRAPGAPPVRLPVAELTRAGVFLQVERGLPPLLSRVKVVLSHPTLKAPLELDAEVVRHVTAAEAQAWKMTPGLALQFAGAPPEARAALARLADDARREPAGARAAPTAADADAGLDALEARRDGGPYALLGLAPDAEFSDVRRAVRVLREELEALRVHPLGPDHPRRATALLVAIAAAHDALATPAARLAHDARRGNHAGVERCLQAGVPEAIVEARRRDLLGAEPARAAEAARQLARAEMARKLGNTRAAAEAYEAALRADPLDRRAREGWAALRARRA